MLIRILSIRYSKQFKVNAKVKKISRIGLQMDSTMRPIKVTLENRFIRDKVLKNLYRLKDNYDFENIRITRDHNQEERQLIKILNNDAQRRNNETTPILNVE